MDMPCSSDDALMLAIEVSELNYTYTHSSVAVLEGINLHVGAGTVLGLLGPNGAGKTTLISLLTGVLRAPADANIHVLGYEFSREFKKIRSLTSLVPQDYAFYPSLTGRENLQHFAKLCGLGAALLNDRIEYCVHVCGLQEILERRVSNYSGGIKRRLNLAIGLLNNPKILYLDEPTVGIDAQSRHFILKAITDLRNEGMTIVYTSHYMEEVQMICDDIAIIDHGRVVAHDSVTGLLGDTGSTQLLIDVEEIITEQLQRRLLMGMSNIKITEKRITIEVASDTQALISLLSQLNIAGIGISRIHSATNKLEQTYLSLTTPSLCD